jgi:hypothetical protein
MYPRGYLDILYFKLLPSEAYQLKMYCILGTFTSQSTHLKIYIMFFSLIRDLCRYMYSSYEYNDLYYKKYFFLVQNGSDEFAFEFLHGDVLEPGGYKEMSSILANQ